MPQSGVAEHRGARGRPHRLGRAGSRSASPWRAWIALRRGDGEAAEAHARAAFDAAPPDTWQHAFCVAGLAEVLAERAQLDEAQPSTPSGTDAVPWTAARTCSLSTRSIVRMALGDVHGRARGPAGGAPAPAARACAIDPDFDGWLRLARLLHAAGDEAGRRREADAALAWARTFGHARLPRAGAHRRGVLEGGEAGLERTCARRSSPSSARRPGAELARSLVELGGALRRDGQRGRPRARPLRRALDLAAAGGLTLTAERAREELRATGARVRRDHATGVAVAHAERAPDRRARGRRRDQPRDRAGAVRDDQDRRDASQPRLSQARHPVARPARPRLAPPKSRVRWPGSPRRARAAARSTMGRSPPQEAHDDRPALDLHQRRPRPRRPFEEWIEGDGAGIYDDLPGYRGSMTLVDRENARVVGIGFYATAGQLRRPRR